MPSSTTQLLPSQSKSLWRECRHWKVFRRKSQLLIIICVAFVILYTLTSFTSPSLPGEPSQDKVISEECLCRYNNTSYDFCYHLPENPTIKGRRFSCDHAPYLDALDLLSPQHLVDLSHDDLPPPAFVTAMSENHYDEGLTLIVYMRKLWPRQKIIVYDLGLEPKSVKDLKSKCLVELRKFPFDKYPSRVRTLSEFRWKPILIAMVVDEYGAVWYMDTSVRWLKDRRQVVYEEFTCRKNMGTKLFGIGKNKDFQSAYMLHYYSGHSIFAATNPGMYKYIPTNIDAIKKNQSANHDANFAFIVKTPDSVEILKWYVMCALEKECIAPSGAQVWCIFKEDRFNDYANCHRYDQSVINLLLANSYDYNTKNYVSSIGEGATIQRIFESGFRETDFACD
ncbi:hypothetical protein Aduo_006843 [Ancylostoma duodenale]